MRLIAPLIERFEHLHLPPFLGESLNALSKELFNSLTHLVHPSQFTISILQWTKSEGPYTRLRAFCLLLCQGHPEFTECHTLAAGSDRLWNLAFLAAENLDAFNNPNPYTSSKQQSPSQILQSFAKIKTAQQQLGRQIKKLLDQFCQDENVLFFLIRHAPQLDEAFGVRFIAKYFDQHFSKGLPEAISFAAKRFKARGFYHLQSQIEAFRQEHEAALALAPSLKSF